jgi:hypothetical protein
MFPYMALVSSAHVVLLVSSLFKKSNSRIPLGHSMYDGNAGNAFRNEASTSKVSTTMLSFG